MPEFVICAATLTGNKGAESMVTAITQNLGRRFADARFHLLSYYPGPDRHRNRNARLAVHSGAPLSLVFVLFPLSLLWRLCRALRLPTGWIERHPAIGAIARADLYLDAGGITFVDGREVFLPFNILTLAPPLIMGRPVVKCAQALGPFDHRLNRLAAKAILPRLALIVARGRRTESHLRSLGLGNNVMRSTDLAFAMETAPSLPEEAETKLTHLRDHPLLGISPSTVVETYCRRRGADYAALMSEFIDRAIEEANFGAVLIPHSARAESRRGRNNDLLVCRSIHERLRNRDACALIEEEHDASHLRAIIGACDVYVSSRFHGMVSGVATVTPTFVCGWSHKYLEVMEDLGVEDEVIDYDDLTPDRLLAGVRRMWRDREQVAARLADRLEAIRGLATTQFDRIADFVESRDEPSREE